MSERQLEEMSREQLIRELEKLATAERLVGAKADEAGRAHVTHDLQIHQVELEMQNREIRETHKRLEETTSRYADLYDFAPVGCCTLSPEGTIRDINLTGAALVGAHREQLVGRSFAVVAPLTDRGPFEEHLARGNAEKVRVTSELDFEPGGHRARAVHIISEPILDGSGRAMAFRTVLIDISELKELENKRRLLSEAGQVLSSSLDYADTMGAVARLAVPALADLCMLDLQSEEGQEDRVVVAFGDARKQDALAERMKEVRPRSAWQTAQARVIESGEPMLLSEVVAMTHEPIAHDNRHADTLREAGIRSLIVVPLAARGRTFGALTLATAESERKYSSGDLRLAQDLANRVAVAVDNARLYAEAQKAIEEHRAAQNQLHELNQTLEQRVGERTKWLTLMHEVTRGIHEAQSWDEALRHVLRRICETGRWQIGYVYLPDRDTPDVIVPVISRFDGNDRLRPFHVLSERLRYTRRQDLPGRVYAEGVPARVNDARHLLEVLSVIRREVARDAGLKAAAALPIQFGRDVIGVLELFSDEPHETDELLENLMTDVSSKIGAVLERERANTQIGDLVWREQQEVIHTLHDSLGQTLTGLGMLSTGLRQRLTTSSPAAADIARQVAAQAQLALEQVRQMSRGLFPVEVSPSGLLPALRELASTTEAIHKIHVQVDGEEPPSIADCRTATQLYRIAQEAVMNAVKHALSHSIRIRVSAGSGLTTLSVTDDGIGIRKGTGQSDGLGLRIMRYRATSVGALLSIDQDAGGGTTVTCLLRHPRALTETETRQ